MCSRGARGPSCIYDLAGNRFVSTLINLLLRLVSQFRGVKHSKSRALYFRSHRVRPSCCSVLSSPPCSSDLTMSPRAWVRDGDCIRWEPCSDHDVARAPSALVASLGLGYALGLGLGYALGLGLGLDVSRAPSGLVAAVGCRLRQAKEADCIGRDQNPPRRVLDQTALLAAAARTCEPQCRVLGIHPIMSASREAPTGSTAGELSSPDLQDRSGRRRLVSRQCWLDAPRQAPLSVLARIASIAEPPLATGAVVYRP